MLARCQVETASILANDDGFVTKVLERPQIKIILSDSSSFRNSPLYQVRRLIGTKDRIVYVHLTKLHFLVKSIEEMVNYFQESEKALKKKMHEHNSVALSGDENGLVDSSLLMTDNPYKMAKKALNDVLIVLRELGYWCFSKAFERTIELVAESFRSTPLFSVTQSQINKIRECLDKIHKVHLRAALPEEDEWNAGKALEYSTPKVVALLNILSENRSTKNFHAIVFAQTKVGVFWLDRLLNEIAALPEWSFIKSDFIYGENSGGGSNSDNKTKAMDVKRQRNTLDKFRNHEINLLVATNIIEEGVDVPACNMVIRFSRIPNFGSFVQSKVYEFSFPSKRRV